VERLYTVAELAKEHGLSPDTIYDWLNSDQLHGFKLGVQWRIHPDDWAAFVAAKRNRGARPARTDAA